MEKEIKKELISLILDYTIKNKMSLEQVYNCLEEVKKVYYSDGIIIRQ